LKRASVKASIGLAIGFGRSVKPVIEPHVQGDLLEVQDGANPVGEFVGSICNP
jgi:hypothetical protein